MSLTLLRVNTFLRVKIHPVSGCIGRIEEKFDVESCLGLQNSSLIQCKTAAVNSVQCYNQDIMTKVKTLWYGCVAVTVTIVSKRRQEV